ncbi:MAG: HAMP domain-containing histidine kinase [Ignavibacteria bacterium]|nr:HAMP domain-containing histidine kinase [Ignavibacteria bacterium]
MAMHRVPGNIKIALVLMAFAIVLGLLVYTQSIVQKLQEKEHRYADLYVKSLEYIGSEKASDNPDLTLIIDEIINKIDFPIIIADPQHVPSASKNLGVDSTLTGEALTAYLIPERDRMGAKNPPLALMYQDTIVTQYVYYDESDIVRQLRVLPYIEIAVATLFILVGYIGFSYIKRTEQANIWVGMSKETAHQLGTPLSSLMGWIELLRSHPDTPANLRELIDDMESDVSRLNRISIRFSKIGSRPDLTEQPLLESLTKSIEYYRKRIPQKGKKVDIILLPVPDVRVRYNAELFEWVLENLMKNALDAMDGPNGTIEFAVSVSSRHVVIDVRDTGKGFDMRLKKEIFRPGYSTKKRGWGLGLSLSKRIIENYHRGKLYVVHSAQGRGTTFRIKLPLA